MCRNCRPACDTQATAAPTPNRHAELMRQYTEELILDHEAWKNWEYHLTVEELGWITCITHPSWVTANDYRRKVKTIRIGGMEVPEPLREAPAEGTATYAANMSTWAQLADYVGKWSGGDYDQRCLKRGILHLTREAAALHSKALIAVSGGTVD